MSPRILFVASPMVSLGGMYSYLRGALPEMQRQGCAVGLLWSARVSGASFPEVDWEHELDEDGGLPRRQRRLARETLAAARIFRPDVVVSLLPQSDLACALVQQRLDVPWVAMVHGRPYPASGEQRALRRIPWRASLGWAYGRADRMLAVSEALAADLGRELRRRDIAVVHNGVAVLDAPVTSPGDGNSAVLGFVGRLSTEKAPDVFVDVARRLDVKARIYGDGPLRDDVLRAAHGLPSLELCGWTPRRDAFAAVDVVLLTSRREGLPLVALEAGAHGRCVVARRVGGVPEVFERDPELAARCLVPPEAEAAEFASVARPLLSDPALRADLARRLRAIVERDFRLDRQVERLIAALSL